MLRTNLRSGNLGNRLPVVLVEVEVGGVDVGVDVVAHQVSPLVPREPRVVVVHILNLLQAGTGRRVVQVLFLLRLSNPSLLSLLDQPVLAVVSLTNLLLLLLHRH